MFDFVKQTWPRFGGFTDPEAGLKFWLDVLIEKAKS